MKEQYIKKVLRALPRGHRQKVERDLRELFEEAAGGGESEQQVIERLGTPEEFAAGVREQLGARQKELTAVEALCFLVAGAAACLVAVVRSRGVPEDAIGSADGATQIQVAGAAIDPAVLLIALAVLAGAAGILLNLRRRKRK